MQTSLLRLTDAAKDIGNLTFGSLFSYSHAIPKGFYMLCSQCSHTLLLSMLVKIRQCGEEPVLQYGS